MNGAESLIRTFVGADVNVCFTNPGTSEMHLVQAIDGIPEMRPVLTMFEGVASGAADGYGRMLDKPAITLLHLGPGLGNAVANLHNARRANSVPIINVIGNHATYHVKYDAPLTSDIDRLAGYVSSWVNEPATANDLPAAGAAAITASLTATEGSRGQIATLIVPVNAAWGESQGPVAANPLPIRAQVSSAAIDAAASALKSGESSILLMNGPALREKGLAEANRIAAVTGCRVMSVTFPARTDGGPGLAPFAKMPYFPEHVTATLKGVTNLVLVGCDAPVSFFAYENVDSELVPEGCEVLKLANEAEDMVGALEAVADALAAPGNAGERREQNRPEPPKGGDLTTGAVAQAIAALMPDNSIVSTDSGGGGAVFGPAQTSAPHSFLSITGGAIGQGGPVATGAAIACPQSHVFALLGDGGAMYTFQALWTQARESLDVTTVIFNNKIYGILETEYLRLGVNAVGDRAHSMFDIGNPDINWATLGTSLGVPGTRATTTDEFVAALESSLAEPGPSLIEAMV